MKVLRDEKRIAQLARLGQIASLLGLLALVAGLLFIFMSDNPNVFLYQLVALVVGFGLSQVGLYLAHRYLRRPRMDQVLDKSAGKFARKDGRLYHYLLPAPHVLLLPVGVVVLVAKYQGGRISVQGDRWTQGGIGMRRFFGREGLGNPTREAETQAAKMTAMIEAVAPAAADVPVLPVIVFTMPNLETLDLKESRIPATHAAKLSVVLRQQTQTLKPLPRADYDALRAAFDAKAAHLLEETVNADAE
jgi:hypothetical protein